uniref:Ig-like domain-containing protein n=1 Tax=Ursus maritimus TaxID=29073 RepID=A0A452VK93_URSMA
GPSSSCRLSQCVGGPRAPGSCVGVACARGLPRGACPGGRARTLRTTFRNSTAGLRHLVLTPAWHVSCVTLGHSLAISVQVSSSAQKKPAPCQACEAASGVRAALGPRPHRASCVAEPKTSPSVFPLGLCSAAAAEYVVIACLVQGFFPPEPVSVTWSPSNENATVRNFPPVKAEAGASYTMSSQLTLPANQCPDDSVLKCQVQHSSNTLPPVSVPCKVPDPCPVVPPCKCPSCDQPRLSLRQPALEEQDSCGCYSVTSVLPGCAEQWNRGDTFSCAATHPESKSSLTATIKKPTGEHRPCPEPQVSEAAPEPASSLSPWAWGLPPTAHKGKLRPRPDP